MFVDECWIDSWKRNWDEKKQREFVSYRINCKRGDSICHVDRRYSQFLEFHQKTLNWFSTGAFPDKRPFRSQTNLFVERRCKDLDAYLQIFIHKCEGERLNEEQKGLLNEFFGLEDCTVAVETVKSTCDTVRTPTGLNTEINRLKRVIHSDKTVNIDSDLRSLQEQVRILQEKRCDDDKRSVERFYELKREWEVLKIKAGIFEKETFDFVTEKKSSKTILDSGVNTRDTHSTSAHSFSTHNTSAHSTDQSHYPNHQSLMRGQEAILSDLAATLEEQNILSKEIYAEIAEQNRLIGEVGMRQEGTKERFVEATARARKLQ